MAYPHPLLHDLVAAYEDYIVSGVFTVWLGEYVWNWIKWFRNRKKPKLLPEETLRRLAELDEKVARLIRGTIAEMPEESIHDGHGAGVDGPHDSDCPCRGTDRQAECARVAGCGFCGGAGA